MISMQRLMATSRGFTVLELMIVMVIVAIGVALAVPTYNDVMQRRATTSQAESIVAFLSVAQGEAIKSSEMVSVHLTYADPKTWCIGASEGMAACDCTETVTTESDFCSINGAARILQSTEWTKSGMTAVSTDRTLVFDPVRGTMSAADLATTHGVTLESDNGKWSLTIDVAATGRIGICTSSAKAVPGYPLCSG